MEKEIGGYFGLEPLPGREYHASLIALNTARNALLYLCRARNIKKLYLPFYLCDSVKGMCQRKGIPYEEYPVGEDFLPAFSHGLKEGEFLYMVNYFGLLEDEEFLSWKEKYPNLIVDQVQAFFRRPIPGIDMIYSCRKFFGVPDGAYLAADCRLEEELPIALSGSRMGHLLGRFEGESASSYYDEFRKNDESFVEEELKGMSRITHNIMGAIDYEAAKSQREDNFRFLGEHLQKKNPLSIGLVPGPYAYPLYCKNGMELKKRLAEKKIYVPTLWPNVLQLEGSREKDYAENILPLPCDQRYGRAEMERILECLFKEWGSEGIKK